MNSHVSLKLYLSLFIIISTKLIVYTNTRLSIFIECPFHFSATCKHNEIHGAPTIVVISGHVCRHFPPIENSPLSVREMYHIFNNLTRNTVNNYYFNFLNLPVFSAVMYWRLGPIADLRYGENQTKSAAATTIHIHLNRLGRHWGTNKPLSKGGNKVQGLWGGIQFKC